MTEWYDDPQVREYLDRAKRDLIPKIKRSAVTIALWGGDADPKNAIELGYMIMLDKPIILLVEPGTKVPYKLAGVADEIIEGDITTPGIQKRMTDAMDRLAES